MSAGTMTQWLCLQVHDGTDDGQGGQAASGWTDWVGVWASVTPVTATQLLMAGLLHMEVTHRVQTWWRCDLLNERRALRARAADGRLFAIKTVRDVDGRRVLVECDAVQVSEP